MKEFDYLISFTPKEIGIEIENRVFREINRCFIFRQNRTALICSHAHTRSARWLAHGRKRARTRKRFDAPILVHMDARAHTRCARLAPRFRRQPFRQILL